MKTIETDVNALSIAQKFSSLISLIAAKEIDFFVDDDIETLHDFRVNFRKLRTWCEIFERANFPIHKLQKHLKKFNSIGGDIRNLDVLIHWAKKNSSLVHPKFIATLKHTRAKFWKAFIKKLIKKETVSKLRLHGLHFTPHLEGVEKNDFQPYIDQYIKEKNEIIHRLLPEAMHHLEQLHEIRKMFKKVRYALYLSFNSEIDYLNNLKKLQDILGDINDCYVWIELIESRLQKVEGASKLVVIFKEKIKNKLHELEIYLSSDKLFQDLP
ncbi:MAG: CHAD domain-containing protein [Campylobacteraceae bacterium]|nr:CHAD domain-containing protein [Campylobacteraceae bacterium]